MKRPVFVVLFVFFMGFISYAQSESVVTLPMLYNALEQNSPIANIKNSLDSGSKLQIQNINTSYFPKVDFNASASWQSDVTSVNIPFPGVNIPSPDPDQYRITLDIAQIIWDGGLAEARKSVASSQLNADMSMINNEIYSLREKVNDAFFGIITIDLGTKQFELMKEELTARVDLLKSGVREGVIMPATLQGLQAEILRIDQKMMELPATKISLVNVLNSITGLELSVNDLFVLPEFTKDSQSLARPEIMSFEYQNELLDARTSLTSKRRMPFVSAFVTSGYGKPGLNMLSNEWNTYVVVGTRLTWNIWDWNFTKREKEQIMVQKNIVNLRKQAFEDGVGSQASSTQNVIEVLERQIILDEQIVDLLKQVKLKSASQLENGLISSAEYLSDFNAAARAQVDMEQRKVNLAKEMLKLRYLIGMQVE